MATNPNKLVADVEELKKRPTGGGTFDSKYIITEQEIPDNSELDIPLKYQVGNGSLQVYFMGEKLIKAKPEDNIDGHYIEVGEVGAISQKIQFYQIGTTIPTGMKIEFVVSSGYNN